MFLLTLRNQTLNFWRLPGIRHTNDFAEMDFSMFDLKYCWIGISGSTFISDSIIVSKIVTIDSLQRIEISSIIGIEEEK